MQVARWLVDSRHSLTARRLAVMSQTATSLVIRRACHVYHVYVHCAYHVCRAWVMECYHLMMEH